MENETQKLFVIKADGGREPFDEAKLRDSIRRVGASDEDIDAVMGQVAREMRGGLTTRKIYQRVFSLLKKMHRPSAARYTLRRAIRELGPSGFPFEKYVGEILRAKGYEASTGVIVQGWCVDHEVDVSARKGGKHVIVECKFHNEEGYKTDLKVALYVYQRFLDIQKRHETLMGVADEKVHEIWLVTNTKLTSKAIQFAACAGMTVVAWDYPKPGCLHDLINETKLHPITVLTTLSSNDKRLLMENGVILCRDLSSKKEIMHGIGMGDKKIEKVLVEVADLHSL